MAALPIEIKEYQLRTRLFGCDKKDVEALREFAVEALTEANGIISKLKEDLNSVQLRLSEHEDREKILKDTITTAQKMVDELKASARKESEFIVAEARHKSDAIIGEAQRRAVEIQQEILMLKKQRIELAVSMKALLDYHMGLIALGEKESGRLDTEADKLKIFQKPKL